MISIAAVISNAFIESVIILYIESNVLLQHLTPSYAIDLNSNGA